MVARSVGRIMEQNLFFIAIDIAQTDQCDFEGSSIEGELEFYG